MKFLVVGLVGFFVTVISGQGWQFNPFFGGGQGPPGLQFNPIFGQNSNPGPQSNPFFNGQNQYPNPPGLQSNPFFNGQNPYPPGPQRNPYFNGQNPYPNSPGLQFNPFFNGQNRNNTNYPPFITNFAQRNNSNPFYNFWNGVPFFSYFSSGRSLQKRALGEQPRYYPYSCMPDHHQCNGSHSVSVGCLSPWDRTLFRQCYVKPGKFFWKREKTVNYPGDFLPPGFYRNETINAIKIQDRDCNGTGGYAQIRPGTGVGFRNATITMYSTGARKGFNFCLQIFGR